MPRSPSRRTAALAAVLIGSSVLAACVTATPYRPATGSGFSRTGFSDQQIERDRFMVSFAGNTYTSRETVERYLLFRAAEITLQSGNDHFVLVERDTDRQSRTYTTPGAGGFGGFGGGFGGFGGPWGGWGPSWRFHGAGFGWRSWSPFWGDPFWDRSVDIRTVDRFEASAEIIVARGPKPATNLRAFDARDVVDRLGPTIRVPEQR